MSKGVCRYKNVGGHGADCAAMAEKFTMSVPDAMKAALEDERKRRKLDTLQDTIRSILSEYFAGKAKR